jgi:ABC-type phosphate transport system substrate-binding protein
MDMSIRQKVFYRIRLVIFFTALVLNVRASSAEVYIIANASNPLKAISKNELKAIFLGEETFWKDGSKIKIVDNLNKKVAEEFYSGYLGRKAEQIKKVWINLMLLGKMRPPESFRDQDELIDYVSSIKEAIAFVSEVPKEKKQIIVLKLEE